MNMKQTCAIYSASRNTFLKPTMSPLGKKKKRYKERKSKNKRDLIAYTLFLFSMISKVSASEVK